MNKYSIGAFALILTLSPLPACAQNTSFVQNGLGSWYQLPGRTACGERMNPQAMTAAHRTLPCGTKIRVTNRRNGKSVEVRVNDRGPFKRGRIVDVSRAAADRIGLRNSGLAPVSVQVVAR